MEGSTITRSLFRFSALIAVLILLSNAISAGQSVDTASERVEAALIKVRGNRPALRDFLVTMPKGADLHNHLSGAVYAETYLRDAIEDSVCIDLTATSFSRACGSGQVPAGEVAKDQRLYDALINAFSMRSFIPTAGVSG